MIIHDFYIGEAFDAYEFFGAHLTESGVAFRVYAPNAKKIEVIGDFNNWDGSKDVMEQDGLSGIFSVENVTAKPGDRYKYRIYQQDGRVLDRFDPYGFGSELRPQTATKIVDLDEYVFQDATWMAQRNKNYNAAMNIYEVHLGSWRRNEEDENGWYRYDQIAEKIIPYLKEMGYTHVEVLPLSEHPFDGSWGYQVSGYYCPTSRYGSARDLMKMVDLFHAAGIGVIIDFVPVHFVTNDYCLSRFDGTALYEYPDDDIGYSEWGTCNFNYYRGEVRTFLQSAADYWLTRYHFDGIRMDAISNVIYWQGNAAKGVNDGALHFVKKMNAGLHKRHTTAMLIAEDSSDYPKVTAPVEYDGLGFDYKWDMGWMNDTLDYFKMDPFYRRFHYHKITFSMMYFYKELYILPFSHDEVVHGKKTIVDKMWGEYNVKFQQAKTLYTYMYTHPGKKLTFMGNELGMLREWDERKECDWMLLDYPKHDGFHRFIKDLNQLCTTEPAFYQADYNSANFRWLECDKPEDCVYIYERFAGDNRYVIIMNTSANEYFDYQFGYDHKAIFHEVLCGERLEYDGYFNGSKVDLGTVKLGYKQWPYSLKCNIPAMGAVIYRVNLQEEEKKTNRFEASQKEERKRAEELISTMKIYKDKAVTKATEAKDKVAEEAKDKVGKAKSKATDARDKVAEEARDKVDKARKKAGQAKDKVAETIDKASRKTRKTKVKDE